MIFIFEFFKDLKAFVGIILKAHLGPPQGEGAYEMKGIVETSHRGVSRGMDD